MKKGNITYWLLLWLFWGNVSGALAQKPQSDDSRDVRQIYNSAVQLLNSEKYREAVPLFDSVIRYSTGDSKAADSLRLIATLGKASSLSRFAAVEVTLEIYLQALEFILKVPDFPPLEKAKLLNNLGLLFEQSHNPERAVYFYEQSLHLKLESKATLGECRNTLNNLATLKARMGRFRESLSYLNMVESTIDTNHLQNIRDYIVFLENKGSLLRQCAEYQGAEVCLLHAWSLLKKSGLPEIHQSAVLLDLGNLCQNMGLPEKAKEYYLLAMKIPGQTHRMSVLLGLANACQLTDSLDAAKTFYKEALHNLEGGDQNDQSWKDAVFLSYGSFLYYAEHQHDTALKYLEPALTGLSGKADKKIMSAIAALLIGDIWLEKKSFQRADDYFRQAVYQLLPDSTDLLAIDPRKLTGMAGASPLLIDAIWRRAAGMAESWDMNPYEVETAETSLQLYFLAIRLVEQFRKSFHEKSFLLMGKTYDLMIRDGINLAGKLYSVTHKLDYADKLFRMTELARAGFIREMREQGSDYPLGDGADEKVTTYQNLLSDWNAQNLVLERESAQSFPDEHRLMVTGASLLVIQHQLDSLEPLIFPNRSQVKDYTLFETQSRLKPGEAMMEFAVLKGEVAILLITHENIRLVTPEIPDDWQNDISACMNGIRLIDKEVFAEASSRLYNLLIEPFEADLKTLNRLVIIPDRVLGAFPFEVLGRDGHFLVEDYDILYHYSAGLWLENSSLNWESGLPLDLYLPPSGLAGAAKTGKMLMQTCKSLSLNIQTRQCKPSLISQFGENHMVHLATHGFCDREHPFLSGLWMGKENDSILFSGELYHRQARFPLVILDACETGTGLAMPGEGVMSMAHAFLTAGSRRVISSLWRINDATSLKFMMSFYQYLSHGDNPSVALRKVKIDWIHDPALAFPRNWGAYVIHGIR